MNKIKWLQLLVLTFIVSTSHAAWAKPSSQLLNELAASVLRVKVKLPNGNMGLGSAVVIAKDEVITNCHVVNDATDISIMVNGEPLKATSIKADWHHDLCLLTVENLAVASVKIGASKTLQYEESIFTIGYPEESTAPVNTFGEVKGLFPMDDSVIIRASSPFKLGASGGGAFDDAGNLIGIITLKSKGNAAHYYYMPVEWVQALMHKPAQQLGAKSEKPFWAMQAKPRPYFMQVVQPYVTQAWPALLKVATQWVQTEPNTAESWFYLAAAEYATKDFNHAKEHFRKVLALNAQHAQAATYLQKLTAAEENKIALVQTF